MYIFSGVIKPLMFKRKENEYKHIINIGVDVFTIQIFW